MEEKKCTKCESGQLKEQYDASKGKEILSCNNYECDNKEDYDK